MEANAVASELEHSRALLRAMLLPDPDTGQIEADVFPRSAFMRFLMDPRRRGMATAALSVVGMLMGRRMRFGRKWSQLLRLAGGLFLARRR
jgi:hypothetical protein